MITACYTGEDNIHVFNNEFEQCITSQKQTNKIIQVLWTTMKAAQEIGLLYFKDKDRLF